MSLGELIDVAEDAMEAWLDFLYEVEETGDFPEDEGDATTLAANWASDPLVFVACGAYRCVFEIEDTGFVAKLPWKTSGKGYDDNLREFEIWKQVEGDEDLEPYLAPAIAVGDDGSWLLMEKADWAPPPPSHDEYPDEWLGVFQAAEDLGIVDLHRGNLGRIDGRIVVIDYASNPYSPSSVPDKYVEGVAKGEKKKRRKEVAKRSKKATDDPKAYEDFKTDIDPKTGKPYGTKESKHTKAYRKAFGEDGMGSVAKVAKATGIPKKIVQEVYDRGLAAWRTGHRPGASQHAWGLARVYSFATGGKTYKTADADLAKKAKKAGFKPKKKSNPDNRSLIRLAFEGEGWFGVGSSQGIWLVVEGGRAIGGVRTDFEDGGPVYAAGWDPHEALDLSVSKGEWENWYRLFPKRDRWETFDVPCTYAPNCAISEREVRAIRQRVLR